MVLKTAPSRVQCVFFAVWRACKTSSRVQWYPKTAPSRAQCVFFSFFFLSCRPHTRGPSKRETKKKSALTSRSPFFRISQSSWALFSSHLTRRICKVSEWKKDALFFIVLRHVRAKICKGSKACVFVVCSIIAVLHLCKFWCSKQFFTPVQRRPPG